MGYWLGKPLIVLAVILLVLSGISMYWLAAGPNAATAGQQAATTNYHRQLQRAIHEAEGGK